MSGCGRESRSARRGYYREPQPPDLNTRSVEGGCLGRGAVRLRPTGRTAGAARLASVPITLDSIFSGLAWALIFGLVVSSAFPLLLVPVVYHGLARKAR